MAKVDPLQLAASAYVSSQWEEGDWRQFGRDTGTSDILSNHLRLYRSQSFGDPDYPDAAAEVLQEVLREGPEKDSGEKGRMELLANSMPGLPGWIAENAPPRLRKLFNDYIAGRAISEIPDAWIDSQSVVLESSIPASAVGNEPATTRVAAQPNPLPRQVGTPAAGNPEPVLSVDNGVMGAASPDIFIVHGHDEAARDSIRIYVHDLTGVMPVSLAEQAGSGNTIIEKFEKWGGAASYVIVLLTPDDVGHTLAEHQAGSAPNPRARQNVVLELGYFIATLGRANVVVMDASVERPSDLAGLSYVAYPGLNWKDDLRKELKAAGLVQ
ncbi:TIR domain-containing protein [Microbacterium sp. NPDC078428]|uniref:TIR domain-containing protein n=1 Tax=Microbacterium sp. NPDC078428 TaxID=3364190 RepID=UPI0037C9A08E